MDTPPFYVVIPARMGSTRLPNKPLVDLGGKPMVVRVAERASLSGAARVIVATDDISIMKTCQKHDVEAVMTRSDHLSGTDRIAEVARFMKWAPDETVVNVQGDEPLIEPDLIKATASLINESVPMGTAAHPIKDVDEIFNPNYVKVVLDNQNRALYFSRAPVPWDRETFSRGRQIVSAGYEALRHIGLYAFRNDFLQQYSTLDPSPIEQFEALEQLRVLWHGYAIAVHISTAIPASGVDTKEDLQRIRQHFM